LSFFRRAEAIAVHRSGCTRCASKPYASSSPASQLQPNAAPDATGVPDGRSPINRRIGAVPFTVFLFSCTAPPSVTTATWDRLRCTSMPT
jgi:hypothetical protein